MQLGVRLAAILLAVTWISPVAQAATVLREFTQINGMPRSSGGVAGINRLVADMAAEVRRAIHRQVAKGYKPRAIAPIFCRDNAATLSRGASLTYTKLPFLDDPMAFPAIASDADLANVIA